MMEWLLKYPSSSGRDSFKTSRYQKMAGTFKIGGKTPSALA
jgi:hypothetical protein